MRLKSVLKWVVGIPVGILVFLFVLGLLAPDSVKAKRKSKEIENVEVSEEVSVTEGKAPELIRSATVYGWSELPEEVKIEVPDYQSYFQGGWETPRNSTQYKKEEGYYVKAIIGNKELAELSRSKAFEPDEVLANKPIFLYGKYKNRWTFQNAGGEISETEKFKGFATIEVKRVGEQDTVWIGPIPEKPSKMTILGRGDDTVTKPSISL